MPIVTETGFRPDDRPDWAAPEAAEGAEAVLLPNDADPAALAPRLARVPLVAIAFPGFADGRGFSLAKRLRALGYRGRLRARGHVIAEQWPLARACGFDEVEIDAALAARQPEPMWRRAAGRAAPPFRRRRAA